ncbi:hypothetical protein BMR18_27530 [Escherichia coli]|nr:hypothetical protein BMR18_27530 [Escherichia coli]
MQKWVFEFWGLKREKRGRFRPLFLMFLLILILIRNYFRQEIVAYSMLLTLIHKGLHKKKIAFPSILD